MTVRQPHLPGLRAAQPLPEGLIYRPDALTPAAQRELAAAVDTIAAAAPFQHPRTKGGGMTSAGMTNCGAAGWWSDTKGYRYILHQPGSDRPWPPMPGIFRTVVAEAVAGTPWAGFVPDACLINFYERGAKMGLHQDRDERDFNQPIVTVSLGDDADFLVGGLRRTDCATALLVQSGDIIVMGGASRLRFHGIRKIYPATSPLAKVKGRISLTFRKAL